MPEPRPEDERIKCGVLYCSQTFETWDARTQHLRSDSCDKTPVKNQPQPATIENPNAPFDSNNASSRRIADTGFLSRGRFNRKRRPRAAHVESTPGPSNSSQGRLVRRRRPRPRTHAPTENSEEMAYDHSSASFHNQSTNHRAAFSAGPTFELNNGAAMGEQQYRNPGVMIPEHQPLLTKVAEDVNLALSNDNPEFANCNMPQELATATQSNTSPESVAGFTAQPLDTEHENTTDLVRDENDNSLTPSNNILDPAAIENPQDIISNDPLTNSFGIPGSESLISDFVLVSSDSVMASYEHEGPQFESLFEQYLQDKESEYFNEASSMM